MYAQTTEVANLLLEQFRIKWHKQQNKEGDIGNSAPKSRAP
jgi:hypothetical protein